MKETLEQWVRNGMCYVYLMVVTVFVFFLARAVGLKLVLPIAMTFVIYPVYALDLSQGRRDLVLRHTLFWALIASVMMIALVRYDDAGMAKLVVKGVSYRDEMFRWILTGEGAEGDIALFFPEHIKHFSLFCAAGFLTGGVWGLVFGSILLNYMNFYVGSLTLQAHHPLIVYLFGWPIWSLVRVVGFILCGIALSEPLLSKLLRFRMDVRKCMRFFLVGLAFIVADILLKAILAPLWRDLLRSAVSF